MNPPVKRLHADRFPSPIGDLLAVADNGRLCYFDFAENQTRLETLLGRRYGAFTLINKPELLAMRSRMVLYFAKHWRAFHELELSIGGSAFQREVWHGLCQIPRGATESYTQLAQRIQRPNAQRAVGSANARNPIAIVIPCHRVIGTDRRLCGYAGGAARKAWLLQHESAQF